MNRERIAWIVSVVLIALLAFQIPGSLAQRDDDYSFVRTLVDIHRQVSSNYVDGIDEAKLRQGAIDGMLSELDPFTVYVPPSQQKKFDLMLEGSFEGVGIQLNQTEDGKIEVVTPVDESPAEKAGVMAGDIILKVNGEALDGLRLPQVVEKVKGPAGTEVRLTVKRLTGEELDLKMQRQEFSVPSVKGYSRKPDNSWDYYISEDPKVAYVRITQFTSDTYDRLKPILEVLQADGMRGLILDLRFNPGGQLKQAVQIVDMFIEKGIIVSTRGRNRPQNIQTASGQGTMTKFPMIVLVNEHSASASEIVAGSLLDNRRALVIGQRSYGKGSVQELIPLEGKSGELKLTVAHYYLPSGRCVHRLKDAKEWGVEPQIIVPMDAAAEVKMMRERESKENFNRPKVRGSTTQPSTTPFSSALGAVDPQLQTAMNTMLGFIIFQGEKGSIVPAGTVPTTQVESESPATEPATEPATNPASTPDTNPTRTPDPSTLPATAPATQGAQ